MKEKDKERRQVTMVRGTTRKRKTEKSGRTRQRGGRAPFIVDFKKGYEVTRDLIQALKRPVDVKQAKRAVTGYKREYQENKRRGGTKGFSSWATNQGYAKRDKTHPTKDGETKKAVPWKKDTPEKTTTERGWFVVHPQGYSQVGIETRQEQGL